MKIVIAILSVLFVVLSTLFLHALTIPKEPIYLPTGTASFAAEPVPNGVIRIERLRFPLALNNMVVFIQNTGRAILDPNVILEVQSAVSHCRITADEIIAHIRPGEKRFVDVSLDGCGMHHEHQEHADLTVSLEQNGKVLSSDTRSVHLRE